MLFLLLFPYILYLLQITAITTIIANPYLLLIIAFIANPYLLFILTVASIYFIGLFLSLANFLENRGNIWMPLMLLTLPVTIVYGMASMSYLLDSKEFIIYSLALIGGVSLALTAVLLNVRNLSKEEDEKSH